MNEAIRIGIIGGSGLYEMESLADVRHVSLDTPFGAPSDEYIVGSLRGTPVAFLSRHGRGHRLLPTEINFRANIYGFRKLGVERIISVTAVGSLKSHIRPLDIVLPDQFVDRTKERIGTFFGNGLAAHIAFADPVCPDLFDRVCRSAAQTNTWIHRGGTLLCIEGPAFSTRAESTLYRQWGMDIIGMTSIQEAKLSREAEICYAAMALVTDFDCWHTDTQAVTVETVTRNLAKNISTAKAILENVVPALPEKRACACAAALKNAVMTDPGAVPPEIKQKLDLLVGKYL